MCKGFLVFKVELRPTLREYRLTERSLVSVSCKNN